MSGHTHQPKKILPSMIDQRKKRWKRYNDLTIGIYLCLWLFLLRKKYFLSLNRYIVSIVSPQACHPVACDPAYQVPFIA